MKWAEMTLDEKSAHIRDGVGRGLSARLIGFEAGVTRNTIIGHAHRYAVALRPGNGGRKVRKGSPGIAPLAIAGGLVALPFRRISTAPIAPVRQPLRQRLNEIRAWESDDWPDFDPRPKPEFVAIRPVRRLAPAVPPSKPSNAPVSLMERRLGFECAFIAGEPEAAAPCCGAPVEPGTSWCPWHLAIITEPAQGSRNRRVGWFAR